MSDRSSVPKHKTEDLGDRLVISIPGQKRLGSILVLGFFALLWLLLGLVLLSFLITVSSTIDLSEESNGILLIVYIGIGYPFIYPLAWQFFGKEEIQITNQFIKNRRVILGFGGSREFPANQIYGLYVTTLGHQPRNRFNHGLILIKHGARTDKYATFAIGVDDIEASQIISEIKNKFPQYDKSGMQEQ